MSALLPATLPHLRSNVIAFSRVRFTPFDVEKFNSIAKPKLALGHWASITRETAPSHDWLLIWLPGVDRPIFRFERNLTGRYSLAFNDQAGWYGIAAADNADDCLALWRPIPDRASSR